MTAVSPRVKKIVELVSSLSENERAELEDELRDEEMVIGRAWADEIDQRATRALRGGDGLSREALIELLAKQPAQARSALAQAIAARR